MRTARVEIKNVWVTDCADVTERAGYCNCRLQVVFLEVRGESVRRMSRIA